MSNPHSSYYDKGSEEEATETALTVKRLEPRRKLTGNSKRLVIALVGLPARGKSFVARKLVNFITWTGMECKIFNVGKYRRQAAKQLTKRDEQSERAAAGSCDANFFDSKNTEAAKMRQVVAELALKDMLKWLDEGDEGTDGLGAHGRPHMRHASSTSTASASSNGWDGHHEVERIAIFDATNSTVMRRQWILEECTSKEKRAGRPTGVVFVESICDDEELLEENFRYKVQNSPDFKGMSEHEAIADLQQRVKKYEEQYETITDDSQSYIKIYNLSTRLMVNHIYGRMAKVIVPALMAWNIGSRPIFLCRPGKTPHGVPMDGEDYVADVVHDDGETSDKSAPSRRRSVKGHSLGPAGVDFRTKLYEFIEKESEEFVKRRSGEAATTGTSLTGLARYTEESFLFPVSVYASTMPRAVQTVEWAVQGGRAEQLSNLNPLDKGDFNGMELEEIEELDPAWYSRLEQDPFYTRFPGGECYRDLINRLDSIVIDIEQQVVPVLVVSHVSVLQLLIAYFRGYPVEKSTSIEVPIHTVLKFVPSRGGSWSESCHPLLPDRRSPPMVKEMSISELSAVSSPSSIPGSPSSPKPIWGDHAPRPARLVPPPPMIRKTAA